MFKLKHMVCYPVLSIMYSLLSTHTIHTGGRILLFLAHRTRRTFSKVVSDLSLLTRPRGYKTFFVLNSTEHEILNAHKYKNIEKFGFL